MKDHQLGYTLPLQPLGAKIERHQATPEDRRAIELCKFEQKRHEVELVPFTDFYRLIVWTPADVKRWQLSHCMLNWIHGGQDEQA